MPELLTVASCRKGWKRISAELSLICPQQLDWSKVWTEVNHFSAVCLGLFWVISQNLVMSLCAVLGTQAFLVGGYHQTHKDCGFSSVFSQGPFSMPLFTFVKYAGHQVQLARFCVCDWLRLDCFRGVNWFLSHLWCPNDPHGWGIGEGEGEGETSSIALWQK